MTNQGQKLQYLPVTRPTLYLQLLFIWYNLFPCWINKLVRAWGWVSVWISIPPVNKHFWLLTKFLGDLILEEFHFIGLPVHQQYVGRGTLRHQLHDAFGVSVCTERHVLHRQSHIQLQYNTENYSSNYFLISWASKCMTPFGATTECCRQRGYT